MMFHPGLPKEARPRHQQTLGLRQKQDDQAAACTPASLVGRPDHDDLGLPQPDLKAHRLPSSAAPFGVKGHLDMKLGRDQPCG